jgi:hypothetical protein
LSTLIFERETRDQQAKSLLSAVKDAMADYQRDLRNTLALADGAKNVQLGDITVQLRDSAALLPKSCKAPAGTVPPVRDQSDYWLQMAGAVASRR